LNQLYQSLRVFDDFIQTMNEKNGFEDLTSKVALKKSRGEI
jgi:hypothetical protein